MKEYHRKRFVEMGLRIAYFRKMNGFTQEQLAEKIGKSWSFIAQIESVGSNKGCSIDTLLDIGEALEVPAYKFLMFDENP